MGKAQFSVTLPSDSPFEGEAYVGIVVGLVGGVGITLVGCAFQQLLLIKMDRRQKKRTLEELSDKVLEKVEDAIVRKLSYEVGMVHSRDEKSFENLASYVFDCVPPDATKREHLWQLIIPEGYPLADRVSLGELAESYPLSGGEIMNALWHASRRAAARSDIHDTYTDKSGKVTMDDLQYYCGIELVKRNQRSDDS